MNKIKELIKLFKHYNGKKIDATRSLSYNEMTIHCCLLFFTKNQRFFTIDLFRKQDE